MKTLKSVYSSPLTQHEVEQLNMVLKHLNAASKKATKKLSSKYELFDAPSNTLLHEICDLQNREINVSR